MTEKEVFEIQKRQQIELVWEELGILKPYLDDDNLSDIMVNQDGRIFLDGNQGMIETNQVLDETKRGKIATVLAGYNKKFLTEKTPILSGSLPSGERVEIVTGEATNFETTISIRIPNKKIIQLDEYIELGSMTKQEKEYLQQAVKDGRGIVLFGGTGTGKTTMINSLIDSLGNTSERIMIVEEVPELITDKKKMRNLARYRTTSEITGSDIVKSLMRQRPDRIIYGELRWGEEVETLMDAWMTGHKRGITSNHSNSVHDGFTRLERLLTEVPGKTQPRPYAVVDSVDIGVHIRRETLPDGRPRRYISEIIELIDYDINLNRYITREAIR